ncbi:hypothetical protein PSEUDO8O_170442 [Pseudomonas sp. 8O]|nr:hypothetical protein PSEUDO8O_170442 [Pseudomonas sp. 8O]
MADTPLASTYLQTKSQLGYIPP